MSDKPEPLAAIVAQMRKAANDSYAEKTARRLEDHEATGTRDALAIKDAIQCLRDDDKYLLDLADRIEAAAEQEAIDAELKWTRIGYDERKAEEKSAIGNAAALREALFAVKKSIDGIGASSLDCDPVILMDSLTQVCARLSSRIEAALATPARNVDRFATAEEARRAFESAHSHGIVRNLYTAAFDWLFDKAEGGDHA